MMSRFRTVTEFVTLHDTYLHTLYHVGGTNREGGIARTLKERGFADSYAVEAAKLGFLLCVEYSFDDEELKRPVPELLGVANGEPVVEYLLGMDEDNLVREIEAGLGGPALPELYENFGSRYLPVLNNAVTFNEPGIVRLVIESRNNAMNIAHDNNPSGNHIENWDIMQNKYYAQYKRIMEQAKSPGIKEVLAPYVQVEEEEES